MSRLHKYLNTDCIKGRLRIFILNLILFVVLVISIFLIIMTKSQLNETFSNELSAIVKMQNKAIEKWINERELNIKFLASNLDFTYTEQLFEAFILNQSEFYSISYVNTDGYSVIDTTFKTNSYFGDETFFKDALNGIDSISNASISKDSKMPIIYFASPVFDEYQSVIAIVIGAVRLSSIQNIVEDFRFSQSGETFIINSKKQLLTKRKFENNNNILKTIDDKKIIDGFYTSYSNKEVYGLTSKTHFERWTIVAQISTNEMYKIFKEFILYVFLFVLALLTILIPLILKFSNKIEEPLHFLLNGSKKIEEGNYGYEIDSQLISDSTSEMRELTYSFNSMSNKLSSIIGELKVSSTIDVLSQLYNRRELLRLSTNAYQESKKSKEQFVLMMIDIDHFKKINDNYGHSSGDVAISMVANSIKSSLASSDIVGRYGGEEFLVCITSVSIGQANSIANRIRVAVEKSQIFHLGYQVSCTCSIGLYFMQEIDNLISLDEAIDNADKALYEAKQSGRNKVVTISK